MDRQRFCGKCGAELTSVGGERLCPGCLLDGGLESGPEASREPALTPSLSRPTGEGAPAAGADGGPHATLPRPNPEPSSPRPFGDYELIEEVARGGMGIVYRARQVSLDRIVAVKMLLFGPLAQPEVVQRFRTEAAAAASLQHPNIVAIHEVGFREGQHFFAMDYVAGRNLAELVREGPLPARQAAGYLLTIAGAIEYAHQRGILHRDLKPSNVLIDEQDQPRVTDFGLAKRLEKDTELTLSGQVLGSPNYMPPEQASAHRGLVGKRSDVYSLGAVLYHLLTGRAPFVAPTVGETLAQVQRAEPVSPTVLNSHLPRDLKTICLKCLEKEPARRYPTAQALADELGRFLRGEPILARPVSRPEKAWRWSRRNPVIASLTATATLLFLLGFAGMTWQAQRASQAHDLAQGRLYAAQMKLAHAAIQEGKLGGALALLRAQEPAAGQPDFREFAWRYLYRLCLNSPGEVMATNPNGYRSVDYSPDGRAVAFGTGDGVVELFEVTTRQRVKRWLAHTGPIDCLAFHPKNSNWLATVSGHDGTLHWWDVAREHALLSTNVGRGLSTDFAFSPGGKFLATRGTDAESVDLWIVQGGSSGTAPTLTLRTNLDFLGPAGFSPDERILAVCGRGGLSLRVTLYDLLAGTLTDLPRAHTDFIMAVAFGREGSLLATGGADERLVVWDVSRRTNLWTRQSDLIAVTSIAFTPDGQSVFASGYHQNFRSWSVEDPEQGRIWPGHSAGVNRLAIAPDGRSLSSASDDGTGRITLLPMAETASAVTPPDEFTALFPPPDMASADGARRLIFCVAVSPAQDRVAAAENQRLLLCDPKAGTIVTQVPAAHILPGAAAGLGGLAFSPDGQQLAVGSGDGMVVLLDAGTLRSVREPVRLHRGQVTHLAYALGGSILVTGGGFGTGIKLTEVASGRVMTTFSGLEGSFPVQPLAVTRDGQRLAMGSREGRVQIRDIASHRLVASSPWKASLITDLAFSPDGQLLAIAEQPGSIGLWDLSGRQPPRHRVGHAGAVNRLAFSPDGRTLASAGMDHTVRLWHPEIDQEVAVLQGHTGWVWCVTFAEHGKALLSGGRDGTLKLWRALSFEEIQAQDRPGTTNRRP